MKKLDWYFDFVSPYSYLQHEILHTLDAEIRYKPILFAESLFGVPTAVVDGELFWGFDATPMLKSYLDNPEMFKRGELARVSNLPGGI